MKRCSSSIHMCRSEEAKVDVEMQSFGYCCCGELSRLEEAPIIDIYRAWKRRGLPFAARYDLVAADGRGGSEAGMTGCCRAQKRRVLVGVMKSPFVVLVKVRSGKKAQKAVLTEHSQLHDM